MASQTGYFTKVIHEVISNVIFSNICVCKSCLNNVFDPIFCRKIHDT